MVRSLIRRAGPRNWLLLALSLLFPGALARPGFGAPPGPVNVPIEDAFPKLRTAYTAQVARVEVATAIARQGLNQEYQRNLLGFEADFKSQGNLDALLAVRQELQRFKEKQTVTGDDVTLTPPALTAQQRRYVDARDRLDRTGAMQLAQMTRTYLDDLERVKRSLTQQDRISAAMAVREEQDRVKSQVDLSVLAAPPAPPPAKEETPPQPTAAAPSTPSIESTVKAPLGYIWVFVTDHGIPARQVDLFVQDEHSGKMFEYQTDFFGKISVRQEPTASSRVQVLSDRYTRQDLKGLKSGNSYSLKLEPRARNSGLVELRSGNFTLPDVGQISLSGNVNAADNTKTLYLHAHNAKVQFKSDTGFESEYLYAAFEQPYIAMLGRLQYEFTLIKAVGDRILIDFKQLENRPAP